MDILLVNPHLEFPSDTSGRSNLLRSKEYLLNMGLLSLSSYLNHYGIQAKILDLANAEFPEKQLENAVSNFNPRFVGISNQSCHSYLPTKNYANLVKSISREIGVVVGGLHSSGIPNELLDESPDIDYVVVGEGESALFDILTNSNSSEALRIQSGENSFILAGQKYLAFDQLPNLDYTQYPDFKKFVPYVEESRGCFSKCNYCISPTIHKGIRINDPNNIASDIESLKALYGANDFHFFMEANNFGVNHKKVKKLAELLAENNISWRCESRIDTFPIHLLDDLVEGGLRVLDIGIESGSPRILELMNKTNNPTIYLNKGIELAEKIADNGNCLLKFNMMMYYGETPETIDETFEYLRKISQITPISVGAGPVRLEPGSRNFNSRRQFDLSNFENSFWGKVHCYPVNLSADLSFDRANQLCLEMAQEFQTSRSYYQAKRHSQLPYNMSYAEFMNQSESITKENRQWRE